MTDPKPRGPARRSVVESLLAGWTTRSGFGGRVLARPPGETSTRADFGAGVVVQGGRWIPGDSATPGPGTKVEIVLDESHIETEGVTVSAWGADERVALLAAIARLERVAAWFRAMPGRVPILGPLDFVQALRVSRSGKTITVDFGSEDAARDATTRIRAAMKDSSK